MTTQTIIDQILGLTRKNQKKIVTEQETNILTNFRDGKELEKKDITKLKKILAKYVKQVLPLKPEVIFGHSSFFKGKSLSQSVLGVRMYISDDIMCFPKPDGYEINKMRGLENLTVTDKFMIQVIEETMTIIQTQLVDAIKEYTKEQDAISLRRKQEVIKGQVTKQILTGLITIRNEWELVIYKHTLEYKTKMRASAQTFLDNNNGGIIENNRENQYKRETLMDYISAGVIIYKSKNGAGLVIVGDEALQKLSTIIAADEADSFLFKMCDKIGGLKLSPAATIENIANDKKNPFNSTVKVADIFGSFNMFNQIVVNTSPLGNPYYQYPCIFENVVINGEKSARLSEFEIKTKINKLQLQ